VFHALVVIRNELYPFTWEGNMTHLLGRIEGTGFGGIEQAHYGAIFLTACVAQSAHRRCSFCWSRALVQRRYACCNTFSHRLRQPLAMGQKGCHWNRPTISHTNWIVRVIPPETLPIATGIETSGVPGT
jgi:hypothetical protein